MSRTNNLPDHAWDQYVRDLSDAAGLLFLWSTTAPKANLAGIFFCARANIADGRWRDSPETLDAALRELEAADLALYREGIFYGRKRITWINNLDRSPDVAKAILKDLAAVRGTEAYELAIGDHCARLAPPLRAANREKWSAEQHAVFEDIERAVGDPSAVYQGENP